MEAERDPNHPIVISLNFPLLYLNITQPLRPLSLVSEEDVTSHSLSFSRNTLKFSLPSMLDPVLGMGNMNVKQRVPIFK